MEVSVRATPRHLSTDSAPVIFRPVFDVVAPTPERLALTLLIAANAQAIVTSAIRIRLTNQTQLDQPPASTPGNPSMVIDNSDQLTLSRQTCPGPGRLGAEAALPAVGGTSRSDVPCGTSACGTRPA